VKYSTNLHDIRVQQSMTIRELEKLSGVSRTHISRIENYERIPSICVAYELARSLNVDIKDLFPY